MVRTSDFWATRLKKVLTIYQTTAILHTMNRKTMFNCSVFQTGINNYTMKHINCQSLNHTIASLQMPVSAFEGKNTPSIRWSYNDTSLRRGFIAGVGYT